MWKVWSVVGDPRKVVHFSSRSRNASGSLMEKKSHYEIFYFCFPSTFKEFLSLTVYKLGSDVHS